MQGIRWGILAPGHISHKFAQALPCASGAKLVAAARASGLLLMEAVWTRFLPTLVRARALVADGTIGEVRLVQADFGFRAPFDPRSRLFAPELAGGALLDLPSRGGGYAHEAEAFMELLRAGRTEPDVMPLDESLSILRTMDAIRVQCGVRYPQD